jgi:hypothetical protein
MSSRCATRRRSAHTRSRSTLPLIAPQYIIDGERVPLAAALQVRIVVMLCTTAQSIAIKVSVDDESVGELAPIRVESELVDGVRLLTNVAVQNWRRAPTTSCSPARGAASRSPSSCSGKEVFSPHDLADLEAEARLLGQLLHKNIVGFRGISVEPTRCCLVTELAPFGSSRCRTDSVNEKRALPFACLRRRL